MIAVSGANGFLGSYVVCELLKQGLQVRALCRVSSSLREFEKIFSYYFGALNAPQLEAVQSRLEWVHADVTSVTAISSALEGIQEVYHCAALVSFLRRDRDKMLEINAEGTANMVNAALASGIRKFCHVSSIAAIGRGEPGSRINENATWTSSAANTNYALSKYKAEMEVWRGVEEGMNAVIVNPGVILGAGDWNRGSCRLFKMVWKGMPFYTHGVNGYVDVKDVARAMLLLMKQEKYGRRYILVSENISMKDFLTITAQALGSKPPVIRVTPFLAHLAAMADRLKSFISGRDPAVTSETAAASLRSYFYDNSRIFEDTGFTFVPLKETIAETSRQFLNEHSI